ncbi:MULTISPECIES: response regulator transcription factor [Crateriforma]|uniref:Oxygen regulatory protein NreC n=1 Tax=Crateriforma conspicua TaxID=2527996 RepID=A0A5C5YBY7_9PLAN|nr:MULTISPECIES: response regulator transcription factor [Crateriforma]QDV61895.1 Oxygen regulatory protein NreC [Crateriforma conspicua]TWT71855.1 Oxygen regulatory protein NreC [Crateriforma conspicua]TWU62726.1 Oxygen regulatory protein NreC [Crateriforma conspicua]
MLHRIVIVDDHPSTRDGLITRVDVEPDLAVCGEAADQDEALEVIDRTHPDLAVVDISLKSGSGIDLIKILKTKTPELKTLVWSMFDESLYAERALRAGAKGYINKQQVTDKIIEAIRTVISGELYISRELSAKMLQRAVMGKDAVAQSPVENLSDRELETFRLIGQGLTTKDIAKTMNLSPKTVETYRARIKEKVDLRDMASLTREATQWVLENG